MSISRQQRRAAEREARKAVRKQMKQSSLAGQDAAPPSIGEDDSSALDLIVGLNHESFDHEQNHPEPAPLTRRQQANRRNAQLSTGPRTEAGKAAPSRNSFKHGTYSRQLVVPGEDPGALDILRASLFAEHQPSNTTERILVNEMAEHYWRLKRFRRIEAALYRESAANPTLPLSQLFAVQRFMTNAERSFHKSLAALRALQRARGFVPHPQPDHDPEIMQNCEPFGFAPAVLGVEDLENSEIAPADHPPEAS